MKNLELKNPMIGYPWIEELLMKIFIKFRKLKYIYLFTFMMLASNPLLGSSMSQFSTGNSMYLIDECTNTISGYSHVFPLSPTLILSMILPTSSLVEFSICTSNLYYSGYSGGTYGRWTVTTGDTYQLNCPTSSYYCFFRNDNL